MTEIDHIVFDIGQVLIHYDPHNAFLDLIPNEEARTRFLAEVCNSAWNLEQDRGRPWPEAEAVLIERYPDQEKLIRAFRPNWPKMVSHAYDDSVAIFQRLIADGNDVTMLTNFAADTFAEAREIFPFLKEPRGVTVSGEAGLIKPDLAIYRLHEKTFDLKPDRTLFIDDSLKNVDAAKAHGWRALHFTGAERLEEDLRSLALLAI